MNREGAPGKSPEEMYIQQKVRVLLMLRKMGSNVSACGTQSRSPQGGRPVRAEQRLQPLPTAAAVREGDAEPAPWLCGWGTGHESGVSPGGHWRDSLPTSRPGVGGESSDARPPLLLFSQPRLLSQGGRGALGRTGAGRAADAQGHAPEQGLRLPARPVLPVSPASGLL